MSLNLNIIGFYGSYMPDNIGIVGMIGDFRYYNFIDTTRSPPYRYFQAVIPDNLNLSETSVRIVISGLNRDYAGTLIIN